MYKLFYKVNSYEINFEKINYPRVLISIFKASASISNILSSDSSFTLGLSQTLVRILQTSNQGWYVILKRFVVFVKSA